MRLKNIIKNRCSYTRNCLEIKSERVAENVFCPSLATQVIKEFDWNTPAQFIGKLLTNTIRVVNFHGNLAYIHLRIQHYGRF